MIHRESTLRTHDGAKIYYQCWQPESGLRGVIVLVHGAAEHGGRYERFAAHVAQRGYAVAALDLPGHGRSEGTPGYIERFSDYTEAVDVFRETIAREMSSVPQILLGHSMGGLVSTTYLLDHPHSFVGCVLSGPAIKTDIEPPMLQMLMIRTMSFLSPKTGVLQLDAEGVSRDPQEVKRYVEDPLNYIGKLSARWVAELFKAMKRVQDEAPKITVPLLILHGGDDSMASPAGSRFLAEEAGSVDKTLEIYPGLYHEIFNEPEREQVFADVLRFCDRVLEEAAGLPSG